MKLCQCNKTVLRFYPEAAVFLNGYTTNVPEAPRAAFTDIQGKIVAVVHQQKISKDEVWVFVESPFVERLLSHLKKYLSLSDTIVEMLTDKKVYWDLEMHKPVVVDSPMPAAVSEEEFTLYRVQNNLPLQGTDFDQEMVLNLGDDSLVSYSKGCYLGQEIVARVHYRGKPPKKLSVKYEEDCSSEELGKMTSRVLDPSRNKKFGFVMTSHPRESGDQP